jgi:hypothetical protein
MKSVLGLLGVSVLALSCSGNGDVTFTDPPRAGSGGDGAGGNQTGGGTKSDGGTGNLGGAQNVSGNPNGGSSSGSGGQNTSGTQGMGGGGPDGPDVIYVATTGDDSADCGLAPDSACKSISQGSARAVEAQLDAVYVQAGTYGGVAVLKPGVRVIGGFDSAWQSGDRTDEAHKVVLEGGQHEESKEYLAVWAHDLEAQAALENLIIAAPNAVGQKEGSKSGRSSYGIHAVSAQLALKDVDIIGGAGADGAAGEAGQDAEHLGATDAMNGGVGDNGSAADAQCDATTIAEGGDPGSNSCASSPSNVNMSGGRGGNGGARDTNCSNSGPQNPNYNSQPGQAGENAAVVDGEVGKGSAGGTAGRVGQQNACGDALTAGSGATENGSPGQAMSSGGKVAGDYFWYALGGGSGGTGQNGSGGGGGGGSGGCDSQFSIFNDARGAGGGGGGAGGCAARGGGGGGGGGGGSFGIFAIGSAIDVTNVSITRGAGGDGGAGGVGGQGQAGGLGQTGGLNPNTIGEPGKGGDGAHGGLGGGGAGGNGGHSVAVVLGANASVNGTVVAMGGEAGDGGDGGVSAPNAPQAERDGADGAAGPDGKLEDSLDCSDGDC